MTYVNLSQPNKPFRLTLATMWTIGAIYNFTALMNLINK